MPSLGQILTYFQTEGGNVIWILLIIFAVRYLYKQDWAKMIVFLVAAGLAYFVVRNPQSVSDALSAVANLLF